MNWQNKKYLNTIVIIVIVISIIIFVKLTRFNVKGVFNISYPKQIIISNDLEGENKIVITDKVIIKKITSLFENSKWTSFKDYEKNNSKMIIYTFRK